MSGFPLLIAASPRTGNGTFLARRLEQDLSFQFQYLRLGEYKIHPCTACGWCTIHPGSCQFDIHQEDAGHYLLSQIAAAPAVIMVAPVYFYGPPAQLKALVDRSQSLWEVNRQQNTDPSKLTSSIVSTRPFGCIFTAARKNGDRLFEASILIMRCFAQLMGFVWTPPLCLRGMDAPTDAAKSPPALHVVDIWAQKFSDLLALKQSL